MSIVQHLIHGELVTKGERTADVFNPSTGQAVRKVELASRATVQEAIDSAKAAFPAWRNTPPAKRAQVMFRFKQLLEQNEAKISQMISEEHGKTLEDAAGELKRGIENVEFACAAPEVLKGEYSRNVGPNIDAWSDFQPLGVVAGITPFNFPAMVPLWMYPLAIACGNAFILKPSERDPSSTLYIAQLLLEAGLPKGILNVVHGDKEAVDALIEAPEVKALSFVGSTPIAEYIYAEGTKRGKRVQALGGREEPRSADAGCRPGQRSQCTDGRGLRFVWRALHGHFGSRVRGRPSGRRSDCQAGATDQGAEDWCRHLVRPGHGATGDCGSA